MSTGQTHCNDCGEKLTEAEMAAKTSAAALACEACRLAAKRIQATTCRRPVMQWEDGREGLRVASRSPIPWDSGNVAMIRIANDGQVFVVHTISGKRAMLADAGRSDMLLVAWPGSRRQDVFIVDDRRAAAKTLER